MANDFHEIQFPTDISYGATGGPEYSTDVVTVGSGHEHRNQNWEQGRCKYNVATGLKRQEQVDRLIAFFRARKGRAYGFRFKDWLDYKAISQTLTTDETKTKFQLIKTYESGGEVETRVITKPVPGSVLVYKNGLLATTGYTIDTTTGIIAFDAPTTDTVTADFEFDVPVRFDTDNMAVSVEAYLYGQWQGIPLIEVRV